MIPGEEVLVISDSAVSSRESRVLAIISTYNEADIIEPVLNHLIENGVEVYLIDNRSTDDTVERARGRLGRGVVGIEEFPPALEPNGSPQVAWNAILQRKVEVARAIPADWYIHHDADEIRESPWPGCSLRDGIQWVDQLGFTAIDFRVLNFPPVDSAFEAGVDPKEHFTRFEEAAEYDRVQIKCWKACPEVTLEDGGHEVRFVERRVFPVRFILRHYPIRSQGHGIRKVFAERKNRFVESERTLGWHVQYDAVENEGHTFLRNPASLRPFDLGQVRLEVQLEARSTPPETTVDEPEADSTDFFEGFLDRADADMIIGWARDTRSPEPTEVEFFDGSRFLGIGRADRLRDDLVAAGVGDGRYGFSVPAPAELRDGRKHTIWANFAGTTRSLQNSPIEIPSPPEGAAPLGENGLPSSAGQPALETELETVDVATDFESR